MLAMSCKQGNDSLWIEKIHGKMTGVQELSEQLGSPNMDGISPFDGDFFSHLVLKKAGPVLISLSQTYKYTGEVLVSQTRKWGERFTILSLELVTSVQKVMHFLHYSFIRQTRELGIKMVFGAVFKLRDSKFSDRKSNDATATSQQQVVLELFIFRKLFRCDLM